MADMTMEEAVKTIKRLTSQIEEMNASHTEELKRTLAEHATEINEWKTAPKDLIAVKKQAAIDCAAVNAACTKRDALIGKIEAALTDSSKPLLDAVTELFDEYKHG